MKRIFLPAFIILLANLAFGQYPLNWIVDEVNPGKDIVLSPDDDIFSQGNRSCRMQLNSGAVPYLISENFSVEEGASYKFSIDVLDNDTLGKLKIYCEFYDAVGNSIFGEDPVFSTNSASWNTIQWMGTVPPDAVEAYVLVKFGCEPELTHFIDTALIWVDNCSFIAEEGSNLVINGGYEDWAVSVNDPLNDPLSFTVFPNPANDYINLIIPEGVELVRLCDLSGRVVLEKKVLNTEERMDISMLPSAIYVLSYMGNGTVIGNIKIARR